VSHTLGASRFIATTAQTLRQQGRSMLAAAPWSLAIFTLSLPFALMTTRLYQPIDLLWVLLALVNLIAFARMTFAWHRVVVLGDAAPATAGRGAAAQTRHLLLLAALALPVAVLARANGDVPFIVYVLLNGADDARFWLALMAVQVLIWLPVCYLLATYGLGLPRIAATGEFGLRTLLTMKRYPRWPLMLGLLLLISVAGYFNGDLIELRHQLTNVDAVTGALGVLLCVPITFVLMTMYGVAYRDAVPRVDPTASQPARVSLP
jgi:hypothetical protein